jgi:hypothetical protein
MSRSRRSICDDVEVGVNAKETVRGHPFREACNAGAKTRVIYSVIAVV